MNKLFIVHLFVLSVLLSSNSVGAVPGEFNLTGNPDVSDPVPTPQVSVDDTEDDNSEVAVEGNFSLLQGGFEPIDSLYIDGGVKGATCPMPDITPLSGIFTGDISPIIDEVRGCYDEMEYSTAAHDNYAAYCGCIGSTLKNISAPGEFKQSEIDKLKTDYYSLIGLGWKNKVISDIGLMKALHDTDIGPMAGLESSDECNMGERDPEMIAQKLVHNMACAITPAKKSEVQQRMRLFFKQALTDEQKSDCQKSGINLEDEITCYIGKMQDERDKNLDGNYNSQKNQCFSNRELHPAASQPTEKDLDALFSIIVGEDVSDRIVDLSDLNKDLKNYHGNSLTHEQVIVKFKNFDTSVLDSIMDISHSTLDNYNEAISAKTGETPLKNIQHVEKVKELLVRNPKLYALISDKSATSDGKTTINVKVLNNLYQKLKWMKVRNKIINIPKSDRTAQQKKNLEDSLDLLATFDQEYRRDPDFHNAITNKLTQTCTSTDEKNPGFFTAITKLLCKEPTELNLPPRFFISRLGDQGHEQNHCMKDGPEQIVDGYKDISKKLVQIESQTCFDAGYELAFCKEIGNNPAIDGIVLDDTGNNRAQQEKDAAIDNFISNIHEYLIDDKEAVEGGKLGSPLFYKEKASKDVLLNFCNLPELKDKCQYTAPASGAPTKEFDEANSNYRDCRTKFIKDNYEDLMKNDSISDQTKEILSQQYNLARNCEKQTGTIKGCIKEDGTSDIPIPLDDDQIAYINNNGATAQQNSTNNQKINDILPSDHYTRTSISGHGTINPDNYAGMSDEGLIGNHNDDFYKNKFENEAKSISATSTQPEMVSAVEEKIENTKTQIEERKRKVSDLESKVRSASSDSEKESFQKQLEQESKYLASQESILKELQSMKEALADMKEENTSLKEQIANRYNQINNPNSVANTYNNPSSYQAQNTGKYVDKASTSGGADVGSVGGDSGTRAIVSAGGLESGSGSNNTAQDDGGKSSVAGELSLNVQNLEQIVLSPLITVTSIKEFNPDPKLLTELYNKDFGEVISVYEEATKLVHLYKFVDGKYIKTHEAQLVNGVYVYTPVKKKEDVTRAIASKPKEDNVERSVTREGLFDNLTQ